MRLMQNVRLNGCWLAMLHGRNSIIPYPPPHYTPIYRHCSLYRHWRGALLLRFAASVRRFLGGRCGELHRILLFSYVVSAAERFASPPRLPSGQVSRHSWMAAAAFAEQASNCEARYVRSILRLLL